MKDLILQINKNILKRYEPNLNNGTVFLFNIESEEVWMGNAATDCILRLIDGSLTLQEIYEVLFPLFEDFSEEELTSSFNEIIQNLLNKGFLMVINAKK